MKRPQLTLIYIPGLGGRNDNMRRLALWFWKLFGGVNVLFVPMRWNDTDDTYTHKIERIYHALDQISHKEEVILVGESAGGAIALSVFGKSPKAIRGVVTICGKNQGAQSVSPTIYQNNPAFVHTMHAVDMAVAKFSNAERRSIINFYSRLDSVVSPQDSLVEGATHIQIHFPGHISTITYVLFLRFQSIIRSIEFYILEGDRTNV